MPRTPVDASAPSVREMTRANVRARPAPSKPRSLPCPSTARAPCPSTVRAVVIFVVIFGRVICHGVFRVYFRAEYGGRIRRQAVDGKTPHGNRKTPFLLGFSGVS